MGVWGYVHVGMGVCGLGCMRVCVYEGMWLWAYNGLGVCGYGCMLVWAYEGMVVCCCGCM